MSARLLFASALAAGIAWHAPASAQDVTPSVYVTYGSTQFAAADTLDAVTGSSGASGFGVGGSVQRLWRDLFVDVAFSQQKIDGERVFVHEGETFRLGIPIEIRFRPLDVVGGWRFRAGRLSPYAGGGLTWMSYRERSAFAAAGDDVDEGKAGGVILGGVDVDVLRLLRVGGELRYRTVNGVLGRGGASDLFGEDDLGGVAFAVRVSVGR
jgi:hypothetical protein